MSHKQEDELMLLWRQGALAATDPDEVARLAGRASMKRFDKLIWRRNFKEYAAGVFLLVVFGVSAVAGHDLLLNGVSFFCVAFVLLYLWSQHRHMKPPDPTSDALAYRQAMIDRIDLQIRLLRTARYWYFLPLFIPPVWQSVNAWARSPVAAVISLLIVVAVFVFLIYLNEKVGIRRLKAERAKVEALYES